MAREAAWHGPLDTTARVSAAVIGSLPPSVLGCVVLARVMSPLGESAAAATGVLALVPVWTVAMASILLIRSGTRAWSVCLISTFALGGTAWLLGPIP